MLIEALRSGEYEQTNGWLRQGDGYCCLGVACDKSGLSEWKIGPRNYRYEGMSTQLPKTVQEWYGFATPSGRCMANFLSLTSLNDSGASFKQIADVIERELKDPKTTMFV